MIIKKPERDLPNVEFCGSGLSHREFAWFFYLNRAHKTLYFSMRKVRGETAITVEHNQKYFGWLYTFHADGDAYESRCVTPTRDEFILLRNAFCALPDAFFIWQDIAGVFK